MIATHLRDIFMPHGRRRDDWDKDPIGNNTRKKAALSYCLDKAFSEMTKEHEPPSEMTLSTACQAVQAVFYSFFSPLVSGLPCVNASAFATQPPPMAL